MLTLVYELLSDGLLNFSSLQLIFLMLVVVLLVAMTIVSFALSFPSSLSLFGVKCLSVEAFHACSLASGCYLFIHQQ